MRHLFSNTFKKPVTPDFGPVCEADVITTGFQFLAPFLVREWLSAGMTPSDALEVLFLADLEPTELDALFAAATTN